MVTDARKVTWLELFFDLAFAAAIAALATLLGHRPTAGGLLAFLAVAQCVFWVWAGHTIYTSRFGDHDAVYRLATVGLLLLALAMSAVIPHALTDGGPAFLATYVAARALLVALHVRPRLRFPTVPHVNTVYILGSSAVIACWAASAFVPAPARYGLWALGIALDLVFPFLAGEGLRRFPVHARHLPERLALFMLLVLGECVIAIAGGLGEVAWTAGPLLAAVLATAAAAAVALVYFNFTDLADHECSLGTGIPYLYAHFPLIVATVALAVGIHHSIPEAAAPRFTGTTAAMVGYGQAAWILAFLGLQRVAERARLRRGFVAAYLAAAAGSAGLVAVAPAWPPAVVLAVALAMLALLVRLEGRFHDAELRLMHEAEHHHAVPRIFVAEARARLERGERMAFLDVRRNPDDRQIVGSVRYEPDDLLAAREIVLPYDRDMLILTYCT